MPTLGAQLYTLRDFMVTPQEIASGLKKVREMGYTAVQTSGLGPIAPEELRTIMDGEGLTCCATHIGFESMRDNPEQVIEEHRALGCVIAGIGGLPGQYRSYEGYKSFAAEASKVAERLAEGGIKFVYHNHAFELERYADGRTGLQILYEDSDPAFFLGEIDTYWVNHGGGDPVSWIEKLSGRMPIIHFKDKAVKNDQAVMAEIGEGNLNWPAIVKACGEAAVEWYVVEQDTCARDPFESLAISYRNLAAMGLS